MFNDDIKSDYDPAMGDVFGNDMGTEDIINKLEEYMDICGTRSIRTENVDEILRKSSIKNPEKV